MLLPEKSTLYHHELKVSEAEVVRRIGSTIPQKSRLKMVYRKYSSTQKVAEPKINLVFVHGTGMNKAIWHYHIDILFKFNQAQFKNRLSTVIAVDCVNHCHSAVINSDNLGFIHEWRDSAKDIVKMITKEEANIFLTDSNNINIIIGHSMGGFVSLYTSFLAPDIFDACVPINPVCHVPQNKDEYLEMYQKSVMNWFERGYMKDSFEFSDPNRWYDKIKEFFKTKSFFANFHPIVLQNMLSDEIQNDPNKLQTQVTLNTTIQAQLSTYLTSMESIYHFTNMMKYIQIPVYRLLSEFDISSEEARAHTASQLEFVLSDIFLPNEKHIVNGENPDLVINHLVDIITEEFRKYSEKEGRYGNKTPEDDFTIRVKKTINAQRLASRL